MPLPVITPPKHMAQMISHTVLSIPAIPRVATSSSSGALPVGMAVGPKQVISTPLNPDMKSNPPTPATRATISGCARSIAPQAKTTAENSVTMAGSFRAMSIPVASGTTSSHGVMRNVAASAAAYISAWVEAPWSSARPATAKTPRAMSIDGTVV